MEAQELREQLAKAQEAAKEQAALAAAEAAVQPPAIVPTDNVASGVAATVLPIPIPENIKSNIIPIARSLDVDVDVSAAMSKPAFRRPRRRAAQPSTAPVVVANPVETATKQEAELKPPKEASQTQEPGPLLEALVEPAVEATIESSVPADTGKVAAQPILEPEVDN